MRIIISGYYYDSIPLLHVTYRTTVFHKVCNSLKEITLLQFATTPIYFKQLTSTLNRDISADAFNS